MKRIPCKKRNMLTFAIIAALLLAVTGMVCPPAGIAAAETDYAVLFESADGTKTVYCETMAEATKLVTNDADQVTLLRDVALGSGDYTGSLYRMELKQGFVLDLNGKVLSSDKSILRLLYSDTTKVSTMTIKNGILVAAAEDNAQHMLTMMNHGGLVLENVKAYCGAYYENGEIVVNTTEVNKTTKGVSAVAMICGDVPASFTDCELVTYGNYNVLGTNNTNTALPKAEISIKNTVLRNDGVMHVIGCADRRPYTVKFLDEKSTLITKNSSGDLFASLIGNIQHFAGHTGFEKTAVKEGDTTYYHYTYPDIDFMVEDTVGQGQVTFDGNAYAQVAEGQSVNVTVTPAEGWYVAAVKDSNGKTLTVAEAGGVVAYTHTTGTVTVTAEFAQYAVSLETAGSVDKTYYKTFSAAVAKVTADTDTITLLRDVSLNSKDTVGTNGIYRLDLAQGFILDLNGFVLSADNSLFRFMYGNTKASAMTVKNGTLVAAVAGNAQHLMAIYNHGSLTLENVQCYNGALYTEGKIIINGNEVPKTSNGVSAALMCCGGGTVTIKNSLLCTYGNYNTINYYNTTTDIPQSVINMENTHLITYGVKTVFGGTDKKTYTVNFLDQNCVLTTAMETNGVFSAYTKPVYTGNCGMMMVGSETVGDKVLYNYATVAAYTVKWANYDGTVLETDENMVAGTMPQYNGQSPKRATDDNHAYIFTGWTPQVESVAGDITYTAVFKEVSVKYKQLSLDLVNDTALYRTQGRPYITAEGIHLDFAGAAIEFEAQLGGMVTMTCSTEKELYFTLFVDGVPGERIHVLPGSGQVVTLAEYVEPGDHGLRLVRDSDVYREGYTNTIASIDFVGVEETVQATAERALFIEFIGDSITSGKYTEMQYVSGEAIHRGINSYAYQAAQLLGADYSMVSRGGCGFFRVSSCPQPAHKLYPYYNGFAAEPVTYTADRKADVVILALGTNDSTDSVTESYQNGTVPFETFVEAPRYVIGQIRAMHGQDVKIVLLHNMMTSAWESELREAAQLEGVYFLKVTQNREGGNNHPSTEGHAVIAQEVATFLEKTVLDEVYVCDKDDTQGVRYSTLQKAADALTAGQYIRLGADVEGNAVLKQDVYLDLCGYTLTGNISGTGTLYLMDSATDRYEAEKAGGIVGTVSCNIAPQFKSNVTGAVRRYMVIADETGYSAHRFYLGITHLNLKPGTTGVGYKAVFYGDEMVAANLDSFGYTMTLGDCTPKTAMKAASSFVSGKTVTLRIDNYDVEQYSQTDLTACVVLKLADGTVIESAAVTMTFRGLMEQLNANYTALTAEQLNAVAEMIKKYAIIISWDLKNLLAL